MNADSIIRKVSLNKLFVLVLFGKLHNSSFRQSQKVKNELLRIDILAISFFLQVLVDDSPVLFVFLHKFKQIVSFLKRPLSDIQRGNELGNGGIDFFLLALTLLLIFKVAFFLVLFFAFLVFFRSAFLLSALLSFLSFVAFLASWVQSIVDAYLLEVVVSEQKGKVALAIAAHT